MSKQTTIVLVASGLTILIGIYITKKMIETATVMKPKSFEQLLQDAQG